MAVSVHFYHYAPVKIEYAINRFTMEAKRLLDVLDKQLAHHPYVAGEEYTIADMAIWPWFATWCWGMSMMQRSFWMPEVIKTYNAGRNR
ncbi:S-transferase [Salmonella enterica subsp. enterica]|uniref:S-transferase n=1 Tax=Salmonella enterica I TaxID=59201 RepID=A0A379VKL8_SALET|nr:S-transferase [Salmonella enterica subsp. enterica]